MIDVAPDSKQITAADATFRIVWQSMPCLQALLGSARATPDNSATYGSRQAALAEYADRVR